MSKAIHLYQSNKRLVKSMWRAVFLLFFTANYYRLIQFTSAVDSNFHTEGGSFSTQKQRDEKPRWQATSFNKLNTAPNDNEISNSDDYFLQRQLEPNQELQYLQPIEQEENEQEQDVDYRSNNRLGKIVNILGNQPSESDYELFYRPGRNNQINNRASSFITELDELQDNAKGFKKQQQAYGGLPEYEQYLANLNGDSNDYTEQIIPVKEHEKQLTAQKKGQSEFVEFVEPHVAFVNKALKNVEYMNKRAPASDYSDKNRRHALSLFFASGNVVFLAFVAMCCIMSVIGMVGGMYYYKRSRVTRDDPFDDFTRYSPAGPGRDRLKKVNGNGRGIFSATNGHILPLGVGEKGDDTLAYKAQLHHYQQTKQKIIGADSDAINAKRQVADISDKSDEEDDADLEHNFSVYECPGLAPTGDIEVQNPNFVDSAPK